MSRCTPRDHGLASGEIVGAAGLHDTLFRTDLRSSLENVVRGLSTNEARVRGLILDGLRKVGAPEG